MTFTRVVLNPRNVYFVLMLGVVGTAHGETAGGELERARAYAVKGKHIEAIENFQHYLEQASGLSDVERQAVRSEIESQDPFVARVLISSDVDGSEVRIDRRFIGTTPLYWGAVVAPGHHHVEVSAKGYAQRTRDITAAAGTPITLDFRLSEPDYVEIAHARKRNRYASALALGIGAVVFAVTGTALVASVEASYGRDHTTNLPDLDYDAVRKRERALEIQADAGYAMWGAASALAIVDTLLWVRFVRYRRAELLPLAGSLNGASLKVQF